MTGAADNQNHADDGSMSLVKPKMIPPQSNAAPVMMVYPSL
jgi:hypothetical protein